MTPDHFRILEPSHPPYLSIDSAPPARVSSPHLSCTDAAFSYQVTGGTTLGLPALSAQRRCSPADEHPRRVGPANLIAPHPSSLLKGAPRAPTIPPSASPPPLEGHPRPELGPEIRSPPTRSPSLLSPNSRYRRRSWTPLATRTEGHPLRHLQRPLQPPQDFLQKTRAAPGSCQLSSTDASRKVSLRTTADVPRRL